MKNAILSPCEYDFSTAIQKLNECLKQKRPKIFNPFWIKIHAESIYEYFCENVQLPNGDVDWDYITIHLDLPFQKRWKYSVIVSSAYENKKEINVVLACYQEKLYALYAPKNSEEKLLQDRIIIQLVRLAQKGNSLAKEKIIECMTFIIYEWMAHSQYMKRWNNYSSEIQTKIESCIRNYRYSGSFMKYLYMSFYYSAKGLHSTCSLNERICKSKKERLDYIAQEEEYFV